MDINPHQVKKDDEKYINQKSSTKKIAFENFEDKKTGTISQDNITDNNNSICPNSNKNKNLYDNNINNYNNSNISTNINININKKDNNFHNINILSKTSKHAFLNKKEGGHSTSELLPNNKKRFYNLQMNVNEEQKQIIKK